MDNKDIIFETDGEENEEELNIDLSKFNQAVILSGELIGQQKRWQGNWKREILI